MSRREITIWITYDDNRAVSDSVSADAILKDLGIHQILKSEETRGQLDYEWIVMTEAESLALRRKNAGIPESQGSQS